MMTSSISIGGQVCSGNLGENIFEEGDFGSGSDNVLQTDPQIAPGYTYDSSPPPSDGSYTITNSLERWSSRFDWPAIDSDRSDDPNGYMMVVNASNEPGKFYEQDIDGLCENTLYVFSVDVINIHPRGRNYILPNVSFSLDGIQEFTTGDIPEDGEWKTYGFTFTTGPAQTSLTLTLSNNAPGGIGNDLILDNIKFQACGPEALILPETVANICEDGDPLTIEATVIGDQYDENFVQWQRSIDAGGTWEDIPGANGLTLQHTDLRGGFYYYRYLLAGAAANLQNDKCRVNSNIKIIHVIPKFSTDIDTVCDGLSSFIGENEFTVSGTYIDTLLNIIGCDSIVTLELTVVEDPGIEADFTINDPTCDYKDDGSIRINAIDNGYPPFDIFENGEVSIDAGAMDDLDMGSYNYEIIDRFGCETDTTVLLVDPNPFIVDLGTDTTITLGNEFIINVIHTDPIMTYEWMPPDLIDCTIDCDVVTFLPLQPLSLTLKATSENGCESTDAMNINIVKIRQVFFPNVFTPNKDGNNDLFTVFANNRSVVEIVEFLVFDRWGSILYQLNNFQPNQTDVGWDGNFMGKPLNTGSYVYAARIRFIDDEVVQFSGNVSLLR